MLKINDLMGVVFSGLSGLVIEDMADENDRIRVIVRTRDEPVPCPVCGALTGRVHGLHGCTVTEVPVDGRKVVVPVTVRRLVCLELGCPRQTTASRCRACWSATSAAPAHSAASWSGGHRARGQGGRPPVTGAGHRDLRIHGATAAGAVAAAATAGPSRARG